MGRPPNSTTVVLAAGLLLKRNSKSIWLCSYRHAGKNVIKSMGTSDEAAARAKALDWYVQVRRHADLGVGIKRISFDQLAHAYLRTVMGSSKQTYHGQTMERHLRPFFEKFEDIREISQASISDYILHRRTKQAKEPQPQTLNRESTVLRQLLVFAHEQRWIAARLKVPFLDQSQTVKRRRHFTAEEYAQLLTVAGARIDEARRDGLRRHVLDNRLLLLDVILLLANSGMRVDEIHSVTWRGIVWNQGDIRLERAGKRKSSRLVILRPEAIAALKRIANRRHTWLHRRGLNSDLDPNERVIATPDGKPVKDLKKSFRALIDACGFRYENPDERHALTSLRHTYATNSLTRKAVRRITQDVLAKQMGTSPRMIQAHYGHDTVEDYRDELAG